MSAGVPRLALRLVTPRIATFDSGVPSRSMTVPFDEEHLLHVREWQTGWGCHDLQGACFDPTVSSTGRGVGDRHVLPGQGVESNEQAGLVVFNAEYEVRVASVQVAGVFALGVQAVRWSRGSSTTAKRSTRSTTVESSTEPSAW